MRFWKILKVTEDFLHPPGNAVESLEETEMESSGDTASKAAGDLRSAAGRNRIYSVWPVFSLSYSKFLSFHSWDFSIQLKVPLRELNDGECHGLPYGKAEKTTLIK